MTDEEPSNPLEAPRKPLGDLVTDIMQSISTTEPRTQIVEYGPNALWCDAHLLPEVIGVDNGSAYISEHFRRLLTPS
ncbi:hypothetical protein P6U16_00560 [Rhizobium sp. 32-5/1]|uniref:hypothetical protein n=1 Tax=Rhizobium sp. 32-5/1 TaxID=3019602 RepID=UPI00240CEE6D|nr:hypothetical protein [Rhizobium sp. 32-5/1]WEZ83422.1 hypothetical protein P6U16_00560 [Rhizobium sp. 32-5/1]